MNDTKAKGHGMTKNTEGCIGVIEDLVWSLRRDLPCTCGLKPRNPQNPLNPPSKHHLSPCPRSIVANRIRTFVWENLWMDRPPCSACHGSRMEEYHNGPCSECKGTGVSP